MKIDDRAESLMRTATYAAVRQDPAQLDEALKSFPPDEVARQAVELALAVILFVLTDIHHGRPDDDEIREVVDEIVEDESWARPTTAEVWDFLSRLVRGEPFADAVPPENVVVLAFVCVANLLAANREDDEKWWDYLDRAEAAIEAAG
ncbi:hypothetical protein O7606_01330 [Micromonospora sp. WMMD882]|uniref:hypothetical protein n=1 Tax=Micromonospora sp. WMMD882 TaxID=3015151 RepID=UPI00248B8411|nr:hypothetical protein [Micromonospora sp. WMMD882]WBB80069.1 hypothetical protein O7606_01330 [Micromonospora sp. WMMD882]